MALPMKCCGRPMADNPQADPRLRIVTDRAQLILEAAKVFVNAAANAVDSRGRFLVALPGGSTPQALFSLLAGPAYQEQIAWPAMHVYWGDERLVPASDPGSNYYHAHRLLFDHVPVPKAQIHRIRGELSAAEAVEDYKSRLAAMASGNRLWPRFDLALMGLGADGHTASLFPGSAAISERTKPVLYVTAFYEDRPAERVTLTTPVFNDAHAVLFLVTGSDKSAAVAAVLHGSYNPQKWPAQGIKPASGNVTWVMDQDAAQLLPRI